MSLLQKSLLALGITIVLFVGGYVVGQKLYAPQTPVVAQSFGSFTPVGGQTYTLSGSGVIASATTIPLTSFTTPDGRPLVMSMFGNVGYAVMDPNSPTRIEDITFTGITQNANGTAILTGVSRGMDFVTPYLASTTLSQAHAGGSYLILSNSAGFYGQQFLFAATTATSSAVLVFGSTTPPKYDADPIWANFSTQVLADVSYVNSVVAAGAANGSETVKGIYQLATGAQAAIGASVGSTGARLVLGSNLATSTPGLSTVTGDIPTLTGSFLNQAFLNLTQAFTVSGLWKFGAGFIGQSSSTMSANLDIQTLTINSQPAQFSHFGGTGADGAFSCSSGNTTINLGGASVVVKNYTSISITGTCYVSVVNANQSGSELILKSQGNATFTSSATPMLDASTTGAAGGLGTVVTAGATGTGNNGSTAATLAYASPSVGGVGGQANTGGGTGGTSPGTFVAYTFTNVSQTPYLNVFVGSGGGGGGGQGGNPSTYKAGDGVRGGGAIVIEVGGALNFTTANGISVAGQNATSSANVTSGTGASAAGGGGGGAGFFEMLYNTLTANSGTVNISGGTGGAGTNGNNSTTGGGGGGNIINAGSAGTNGSVGSPNPGGAGGAGYSLIGQNPR